MKQSILSLLSLCMPFSLAAKILIFTYAYNQPDFITIQYKTFKKFLKDEYEFIVFNDASQKDMRCKIKDTCKKLGIQCFILPQEIHNRPYTDRFDTLSYQSPMARNSNVVQYSLDTLGLHHDDIVALVDSDLFLIKEFSIRKYLKDCHLAGFNRPCYDLPPPIHNCQRDHPNGPSIEYLWIGLIFINMKTIPDKWALNVNGAIINNFRVDPGGNTYYSLCNKTIAKKFIDRINIKDLYCNTCDKGRSYMCKHTRTDLKKTGLTDRTIQFVQEVPLCTTGIIKRGVEFFLKGTFIHYKAGTNWNNAPSSILIQKRKCFENFINDILQNT